MRVIIVDRDAKGNPVVREEHTDLACIPEPSNIFWETRKALRGRKSMKPAARQAFMESCKKSLATLE